MLRFRNGGIARYWLILVRTYMRTGEPVSSRAISKRLRRRSSNPRPIANVMAHLEDGGFFSAAHFSGPRAYARRIGFFAQEIASRATLSQEDRDWIKREFNVPRPFPRT